MKTTILKIQKSFLPAMIAIAFVLSSSNAHAVVFPNDSSGKDVTVQYLGTVYGQPLFQLKIENEAAEDLLITLENMNGEALYTKKLSEKVFQRKIQIATTESNISLTLRVYSFKTKETVSYEINKVTKYVDDLVVTRVNQ